MKPDNRIIELCERLTSPGHCPSKLSASEFHELANYIFKIAERPKVICICGSSRFVGESAIKAWEFNKQGIATFFMPLLPLWYPGVQEHHQAEHESVAANLDNLWLKLIDMADEVFVVNCAIPGHEDGYIGERTAIEIKHAESLGKTINYFTPKKS